MSMNPRLIFRWIAFLLAGGYCIHTLIFGGWDAFGGPFRFLTIWGLFCAFFAFSRLMALEEERSTRRWDGFISMAAVLNAMVLILYWRIFYADSVLVTGDGGFSEYHIEIYRHGVGPALVIIDAVFIHRSFTRLGAAGAWLIGVIGAYIAFAELLWQPLNDDPSGSVTSGIPYRFLNDLEFADRAVFYAVNFGTALVLLVVFAGIAWGIRRQFPAPVTP
ncbi:FAR-17a/AIG1-like protein [Yoonia maricola]|uniref:FAR-17a/AIG1-like protein n=1 Tax=Yoonia maricola TaxID=420999 RepID=A0A2M8W526_9RHOB|nr:androgen-induced gene 1 family protein [Yoonia maricola]PJI86020.1 FAR-17a/AIG1-like protein [Yoonia maricola]